MINFEGDGEVIKVDGGQGALCAVPGGFGLDCRCPLQGWWLVSFVQMQTDTSHCSGRMLARRESRKVDRKFRGCGFLQQRA